MKYIFYTLPTPNTLLSHTHLLHSKTITILNNQFKSGFNFLIPRALYTSPIGSHISHQTFAKNRQLQLTYVEKISHTKHQATFQFIRMIRKEKFVRGNKLENDNLKYPSRVIYLLCIKHRPSNFIFQKKFKRFSDIPHWLF